MSQPDPKRQKTSDSAAYELVYWPGLPGRGEFVRLVFEESGTPYVDLGLDPPQAVSAVKSLIDVSNKGDATNPPVLAPPALKHGDLTISQLPNILLYLAPKLDLAPKEGDGIYYLNQIVLTIIDGFVNELHDTHHPIAVSAFYDDQKAEAKKRSDCFTKERVPKFLGYVQRLLDGEASGDGPWLYGGKVTYADLVLFQCIHGTKFAFPKTMDKMEKSGEYDSVFKLYEAVGERPNIKSYMESERRQKYGNGIWRHYPELEE